MQMSMSTIKEELENLQEVLDSRYKLERQVEELPKNLDSDKERLEALKKEYIEKNAEYEEQKAKVSALKTDLEAADKERELNEKNMDATTTHREYEMLDKLINDAKNKEASIRRELQHEEKILDEMKEKLSNDEAYIGITEKEFNEANDELTTNLESFKSELESLAKREAEITERIADPEVVSKFQRIIKRNSDGIVAVRGSVCTGCNMILPAQFANNVHHSFAENDGEIYFCPYCSRVLYYEEVDEDDENFIPTEEAGSLAFDDEDEESQEYDPDIADEGLGDDDTSL